MLGRVLNSHQQWLCRQLSDSGWTVARQTAVPDRDADIEQVVREALGRADLVITTGGLGPTSDDLTRDRVAQLLGKTLSEDRAVLAHIEEFFQVRHRPIPERTRVQAMVPEGAIVLHNSHGTAPGLAIEVKHGVLHPGDGSSWLVMLPGPPRELRPMFTASVLPLLRRVLPPRGQFVCRTLRSTGIGESMVEQRIADVLRDLVSAGLELGYCARPGQVDVRLAAHGPRAEDIVNAAEKAVLDRLGAEVFGREDDELENVVVRSLAERKETLALAESCTGGAIAHRLTNVPGASAVLLGALVTYSNEAKQTLLGVHTATLAEHGAVSEPVAREMAQGARKQLQSTYAVSVSGIAGPSGGTVTKPVGTVFIALAGPFETVSERNFNPFDRETFKQVTAQQALDLLRRKLLALA